MPFFRDNSRSVIGAIIAVALLLIFYYVGALSPVERVFNLVVEPLQSVGYSITDSVSPLYEDSSENVVSENTLLKAQLASLATKNSELTTELAQFKEYEEQLKFAQQNEYTFVPAKVISRVGQGSTTQIMTINQGAHNGITEGYPVIYNDGILVGVVTNVQDSYSEVALVTGSFISIQGMVQNDVKTPGLIRGEFGTGLLMDLILKDNPVAVGDIVVTSGQDQFIPEGLLIGTVDAIRDESSELFKQATLRPILPYSHSSIVSVVVPN